MNMRADRHGVESLYPDPQNSCRCWMGTGLPIIPAMEGGDRANTTNWLENLAIVTNSGFNEKPFLKE